MIGYIIKLLKSLNENTSPGEIAHAVSIGILLGLMPKNNLLWYMLFVFFLFVRSNKSVFFLMTILSSLAAPLLDPVFNTMGEAILLFKPLVPVYRTLLDIPFVGFTKFNNTIVTGSLVTGLILYIPVYLLARLFVAQWRTHIASALAKQPFVRALYKLPLIHKIIRLISETR
jgi:uncharacterized protein (TIGR03546 family)